VIRKTFIAFFCFLICVGCFAQSRALFRIVTLSYGVNIDGEAISVGQYVKENSRNISIPKGGYLGVITSDGNAGELKQSIAVADVNDFVVPNFIPAGGDSWLNGATQRPYPSPLRVFPVRNPKVFGDSVFLLWEENMPDDRSRGIEYEVRIRSDREEDLIKGTEKHNWVILDMKPFFNNTENSLFVDIRSKKTTSFTTFVLTKSQVVDQKLMNDLERLGDHRDLAMLCAVFEVNGYYYDRNLVLYKIITRGYQPTGFMIKYLETLTKDVPLK
jgi:hypothetical protein